MNVLVAGNGRPVLPQHGAAVGIGFALPHDAHTGALESEIKSADSREEGANGQHPDLCLSATVVTQGYDEGLGLGAADGRFGDLEDQRSILIRSDALMATGYIADAPIALAAQ
jgi:hypothetical protein